MDGDDGEQKPGLIGGAAMKPAAQSAFEPPAIESAALFAGRTELVIVHANARYRLRITRQNKLILTK